MNTLPSADTCCDPCESPVTQAVPGPAGAAGANGTNGTNGVNAYTATTANFTMPAELATVSIFVSDATWVGLSQIVYIATAGYFQVTAINSATNIVVRNLESAAANAYLTNTAPATNILSGSKVSPAGLQGSGAISGLAAGGHLKGTYPNPTLSIANTKGTLIVGDGTDAQGLAVGSNGQFPCCDSAGALGIVHKTVVPVSIGTANAVPRLTATTGSPIPLGVPPTQLMILTDDGDLRTAGGNARGLNAVDLQSQRAVATQVASGARSVICGGDRNTASGTESCVVAGDTNNSGGARGFIGGGQSNTITAGAAEAVVAGGTSNTIGASADQGVICGGEANQVLDDECFVGGGNGNIAGTAAGADRATVAGGDRNQATGLESFVGGGEQNIASNSKAAICGGNANAASGDRSAICGGETNSASGTVSFIGGGGNNIASGSSTSIPGGTANTASGIGSAVVGGISARADKYCQIAHASGVFASQGDAQTSELMWRRSTTDATITELFLDGASLTATIPASTAWVFRIMIVGRRDNGDCAVWHVTGGIKNNGGVASLIGAVTTTLVGADAGCSGTWGVAGSITTDATGAYLRIRVTGTAANNIRWVARARIAEVNY